MAHALSTPLKDRTASTASLAPSTADSDAAGVDGGVHIDGLEAGAFAYLRTTARAQRDLCSLLLRLMQARA